MPESQGTGHRGSLTPPALVVRIAGKQSAVRIIIAPQDVSKFGTEERR